MHVFVFASATIYVRAYYCCYGTEDLAVRDSGRDFNFQRGFLQVLFACSLLPKPHQEKIAVLFWLRQKSAHFSCRIVIYCLFQCVAAFSPLFVVHKNSFFALFLFFLKYLCERLSTLRNIRVSCVSARIFFLAHYTLTYCIYILIFSNSHILTDKFINIY